MTNLSGQIIQIVYRDLPAWVGWSEFITAMQVEPSTSEDAAVLVVACRDLPEAGPIELRVRDGAIFALRIAASRNELAT